MIKMTIFFGEDIISSRKAFLDKIGELKSNDIEVVRVLGKDFNKTFIVHNLESNSLFGNKRVAAVENFFSGQKSKDKEESLEYIEKLGENAIFWETKEFTKGDQDKLSGSFTLFNFKLPQQLFSFLDKISFGKTAENLKSFEIVCQTVEPGFIFQMLIRQIRLLILAKDESCLTKLAPWQKSKVLSQAKSFPEEKLHFLYKKLLEIDFQQKTSTSPLDLKSSLELFLSEI